jgi:hypothetical protein
MKIEDLNKLYYTFNGKFKSETPSPANTPEFDELFIEILQYLVKENDLNCLTYDGEGSYGGRQFTITVEPNNIDAIRLEVVLHDNNNIVVYTGRHEGFTVAPFMSREDIELVWRVKHLFRQVMGLA